MIPENTGSINKQPKNSKYPDYMGRANVDDCLYDIEGTQTGSMIKLKFTEARKRVPFKGKSVTTWAPVKRKPTPKGTLRDECADQRKKPKSVSIPKSDIVCRTCIKLEKCITDHVKPTKNFSCYKGGRRYE